MTPLVVEEMTFDQILILAGDKKRLGNPRFVTGSPAELARMGLIPPQPARSEQQIWEDQQAKRQSDRELRKQRKAAEREERRRLSRGDGNESS